MARDNKREHMSTIAQYVLCEEKAELSWENREQRELMLV